MAFQGSNFKILQASPITQAPINTDLHKMDTTVCDPFGTTVDPSLLNGIHASLAWLPAGSANPNSVMNILNNGVQSTQELFFSELNTPTRLFTEGFSTQLGGTLTDDSGDVLTENFALHFTSGLRLPAGYPSGNYELATISDDGSIMTIPGVNSTTPITLINNDGLHEARMGCSSRYVALNGETPLNFDFYYYQGPRYEIANMLMWRPAPTGVPAGSDSSCGAAGNYLFFNPDTGSSPEATYISLLTRGWTPVPSAAFVIPDTSGYNPCHAGTAPVISNVHVAESTSSSLTLAWTTDIPSTTQVRFTNLSTGLALTTDTNSLLSTSHVLQLTSLLPGTSYSVIVMSTSADNGQASSTPVTYNIQVSN